MKTWEIWAEGYAATGESGTAQLMGHAEGKTFRAACKTLAEQDSAFRSYFNAKQLTYWGCGLFPTEEQARRTFG